MNTIKPFPYSSGRVRLAAVVWAVILIGLGIFFYQHPQDFNWQKYWQLIRNPYAHCQRPLPYAIGSFDNRFHISQTQFLSAIQTAAHIWQTPLHKSLFVYNPAHAALPINLVYDYRQAATDTLKGMGIQIENTKSSYDDLASRYQTLKAAYDQDKAPLLAEVQTYDTRKQQYEQDANYWNSRGGAPEPQYQQLQQERAQLDAMAADINQKQDALNQKVGQINAMVSVLNKLAQELNLNVQQYNAVGQQRGQEFEEGNYETDANGRRINIYEFANNDQLVRVLAHELGHALGLQHVSDPNAIMYGLNQSKNEKPTAADLAELKAECEIK